LQIIFSGNDLICTGQVEFAIFRIPPLDHDTAEVVDVTPLNPILRLACPLYENVVSAQTIWCPGVSGAEYFDSIGEEDDGSITVSRYVLKPITNDPSDGLPSRIPIAVDWFKDQSMGGGWNKSTAWRMSDSDRLIAWLNDAGLYLHLSTTSGSAEGPPGTSAVGFLWKWPKHQAAHRDRHHAFCPMSGRLCISSWDHEIRVLDYLMPPE